MNTEKASNKLDKKSEAKLNITNRLFERIIRKRKRKNQEDKMKNNLITLYPSEYKNFLLNYEEKKNNSNYHYKMTFSDSICSRTFKIIPTEIIFRQYSPGNIYNTTLTITNIDKSSHIFRLNYVKNSPFDVEAKKLLTNTKLAPGMSQSYNIKFIPEEKKDYYHQLDIVADCEAFSIPLIAIGPRALLDFPDQIVMPETAVKIPSSKIFLIQNIGDRNTTFTSLSESEYFSINPESGMIKEKEAAQFSVNFITSNPGNFYGIIYIEYDTGELIRIDVQANAVNCNIYLDNYQLRLEDTFIGLSTIEKLKIYNDSDYLINFQWVKYQDSETDTYHKKKLIEIFGAAKNAESMKYADLKYYDICRPEVHETICERIYKDEVTSLLNENFVYSNSHFSLAPIKGTVLPRSYTNIIVDFQPLSIGNLTSTAYLEVTGRVERIPVQFIGVSKGPIIKFKNPIINIGDVYIFATHNFQAICKNEGLVSGTLIYKEKLGDYSSITNVTPNQHEVEPEEFFSFDLTFSSSKHGQFTEKIYFQIEESDEIITFCIRGNIILPTLQFDKTHLNFGTTALGFTSKHKVNLSNDSPVSIKLNLSISDGNETPVTYESFTHSSPYPASNPKEFFIEPQQLTLNAQSSHKIIINFTPNIVRESNTCLEVKIDGFNSIPVILPIIYKSKAASFEIKPINCMVELCYINFPFTLPFTIKNKSDVDGFAYKGKQSSENLAIFYSMSQQLWHLRPDESKNSSVTLIATKYGRQSIEIPIMTFGNLYPLILTIVYNCQGATVLSIPTELDWEEVKLLEKKSLSFRLFNNSPVPAKFKAIISNNKSPWSLSITSGEINPLKLLTITATVFMREAKKLCDKILISILNSSIVTIVLKASGIGSPIVIDPNIFPTFDMGCFFNKKKNYLSLMVINEGNQFKKIIFSSAEIKTMKSENQIEHGNKFLIEPFQVELLPQNKKEIMCMIYSEKLGNISEEWWIYSLQKGQKIYDLVGKSFFTAKFIKPLINFDKNKLLFFINIGSNPEELSEQIIDEIKITNTSELDLQVHVSIKAPFSLLTDKNLHSQSIEINLCHNLVHNIKICFTPLISDSQCSSTIYRDTLKFEYDKYPKVDEIECEASIIYPYIIIDPDSLQLNLILGSIVEKEIMLINERPVTVYYNVYWAEENIKYLKIKSVSLTSVNTQTTDEIDLEKEFQIFKRKLSEDKIENLIKIVPVNGFIPPFSKKSITCTFYTQDPLLLKAKLFCQVLKGSLTSINIVAKADTIRYHLNTKNINFGNKLIFKSHYETFTVKNVCNIQIDYKLEISSQEIENRRRIFSVDPKSGCIKSGETVVFTLQYKPLIPDYFEEFFYLDIENLSPIKISIQCYGIFPQVYLSLPWANAENFICQEYHALQYFEDVNNEKNLINKENTLKKIPQTDLTRLILNGWNVINCYELPQIMDINMAIERYFATKFIKNNYIFLNDYIKTENLDPVPNLLQNYVLNLGYVVTDQSTYHSLTILNYSPCKLFIKMKQPESQKYLSEYGITIKFKNPIHLQPTEICVLEIFIKPSSKIFLETSDINRKIFLEVANGYTVSILITGIITFPSLKAKTNHIDFKNVFIGECKVEKLLIENIGLIECRWKIKLSNENKKSRSFHLIETEGITFPKQRIVINIHFKPHKSGYQDTELIIFIEQSCESMKIKLIGRGLERKLNISEPSIDFFTNLYDSQEEHIFYIENPNFYPVEFYWQHLDKISDEEDKIIRALLIYYQINEIFLPTTKIGAKLPQKLYEFYYSLVNDAKTVNIEKNNEEINNPVERIKTQESSIDQLQRDNTNNLSTILKYKNLNNSISYDKSENLIYSYINDLHKQNDFLKTRKDPIKEIFDDYYKKININNEKQFLIKKICIIFHGAPFTSHQETACRAARKINLPLINLNTVITEFIALKNSSNAIKIKEIIYQKYEELLTTVKGLLENFDLIEKKNNSIFKEKSNIQEVEIKSLKNEYLFYFSKPKINNLIDCLQKIPTIEELNSMDSISCLEYQIEGIHLFESIIDYKKKLNDKSNIKNRKRKSKSNKYLGSFLNIDVNLFKEILQEILKSDNFKKGFILQTLANNFIKNEAETFSIIINNNLINFLFFITFDNSLELYQQKLLKKLSEIEEENKKFEKKLDTDDKALVFVSKFDFGDKSIINEKILNPIIETIEQNCSESSEISAINNIQKESESDLNNCTKQETKKNFKKIKNEFLISENILCELNGIKKMKKSKAVAKAFNTYNSNLKSIRKIIDHWITASNANDAYKWHAKFSDPWDPQIYDLIINQLLESDFINKLLSTEQMRDPNLYSEVYRVLTKRQQRNLLNNTNQLFKLYSLPNFSTNENISAIQVEDIEPRSVMKPGEIKYFKIVFNPENIGTFQQEFFLNIIGNDQTYRISVNGFVDNPTF